MINATVKTCSRVRIINEVQEFKKRYDLTSHDVCSLTGLSAQKIDQFLNYPASYNVDVMNKLVDLLNTRISFQYYPHGKRTAIVQPKHSPKTWMIVPLDYVFKNAEW